MANDVGQAIGGFERALAACREALSDDPRLVETVFNGTEEWSNLLTYKLVPHLAGEGCLVVAVAGGTNTGKSTVFNTILGRHVSPIVTTAAATCHPVIAANVRRGQECLDGRLVPEFECVPLADPGEVTRHDTSEDTLFVAEDASLPDDLVLMDTPDIDSIDTGNWDQADCIRAAGDVIVAVVTGEKYKDERVVRFFREALASGRVIVPLINKADPRNDYSVARRQLTEFCSDVGVEGPCFVMAHDFEIGEKLDQAIPGVDGSVDLRIHLRAYDVAAIKAAVYRETVRHFAQRVQEFLDRSGEIAARLSETVNSVETTGRSLSEQYDPAPGEEVGGLFHEYVQSRRGTVRRVIGSASAAVARGASALGGRLIGAFKKRARLDAAEPVDAQALDDQHRQAIERITRDLVTDCIQSGRDLREPAADLFRRGLEGLDVDAAVAAVINDTLTDNTISDEFREHAVNMLNAWWADNTGKRRVLEGLDAILAVVPAAIAAPIAIHTAGVGASEAAVIVGPIAEQFVARVVEYQFGDAMFDFLSPWRREQREKLEAALMRHVTGPTLDSMRAALEAFEGESMTELKRCHAQCLIA
jgi:hypothetical protein